MSEPAIANSVRRMSPDNISVLETPELTYSQPKLRCTDDFQAQVVIVRSAEEEELRARVRAFSQGTTVYSPPASPSSVYSQPGSHMHPSNMFAFG